MRRIGGLSSVNKSKFTALYMNNSTGYWLVAGFGSVNKYLNTLASLLIIEMFHN